MKVLSLFDGMSVAQQALKNLGVEVETYYASEIDPYAISVTQSNFPNTIQIGDVKEVKNHWGFINARPDIDLMIGGSPCQDLSIAKKNREGLEGSRSGLFWEYVRIRDEVKPKYFILENVASMPREAKDTISEALGVQPVMINASLVSAQNRKRLFWVGKWNGEKYEQVDIPQPEDRGILLKDILESGDSDRLKSYCVDANYYKGTNLEHYLNKGVRQVVFNKFSNQVIGDKGRALNTGCGSHTTKNAMVVALTETRTEEAKAIRKENMKNGIDYSPRRAKELVPRKDEKANTITTGQTKESLILTNTQIRKLTPMECLRLQSMPDDYFDKALYKGKPISNTQRYKMCGNAFNCKVVEHIIYKIT